MHLGHIISPGDENIRMIHVLITTHRLINAKRGHKAGDGTCHTEPCIGLHIIGAKTAFKQLRGNIAIGNSPLT